jgi:hypothetical protein
MPHYHQAIQRLHETRERRLNTHSDKLELHIALSAMNYAKNARRTRRLKS